MKKLKKTKPVIRKTGGMTGLYGSHRERYEFVEPAYTVVGHSCLMPKFNITLMAGELRRMLSVLKDNECLQITVAEHESPTFTFLR